tara:strand:+ start:465 stop:983 length:519 start_codon:yes stop_codon:yes gene_type:complete
MSSILKVDTIQTTAGAAPSAIDLGLDVSGTILKMHRHAWSNEYAIPNNSSSLASITGSSFSFTPKSASSTLIIVSDISCRINGNQDGLMFLHYVAGSSISHYNNYAHEIYFNTNSDNDIYFRQTKSDTYSNTSSSAKTIELYARDYRADGGGDHKINVSGRFASATIVYEIG